MLNTQLELIHMTGYKHNWCHFKCEKELVQAYMSDVLQIAIGQGSACTPNCGAAMEGFTFSCSEFFASAFSRHSLTLTTLDAGRALEIVTAIKQEEWILENHGILNCVSMITLNLRKPNTTALDKPT